MSNTELLTEEDEFNQRGQVRVDVENSFLDGSYDEELFVQRIEQYKAVIGLGIYNMGRALIVMKENCGHGNFLPLLERMDITPSIAQKSMKVAAKFNTPKLQKLIQGFTHQKGLGTKLLALAVENDDDLEMLAEGGAIAGLKYDDIDRMSPTEVRQSLRKARKDAKAEKETNDRIIAEKNDHADGLSKKLATIQGTPKPDRWPEHTLEFNQELSNYAEDTEKFLMMVIKIVESMGSQLADDTPVSVYESWAASTVAKANRLEALVAHLQSTVVENFSGFIEQPTYILSDPLQTINQEPDES